MSKDETDKYRTLVSNLENELKSKGEKYRKMVVKKLNCILYFSENKNSMLEAEIRSLQRRLVRRDNEILKQERELHKLRVSVSRANGNQEAMIKLWYDSKCCYYHVLLALLIL